MEPNIKMTLEETKAIILTLHRILKSFFQVFSRGQSFRDASALAYTSLISFVPLMAVSLSIFSAFPAFDNISTQMQDFAFENFVPTSGKVVQEYLLEFSNKAKRLTGVGIIFLVITSILLMSTIERALNSIWQVSENRNLIERFTIYWSVLTVGPLLMGMAMVVTSYIVSIPFITETASLISRKLGFLRLVPFSMETIAFVLLYIIVPNIKVAFRDALPGGMVAAVLFEIAKSGFAWYITRFPTYETIYGALSVIPIFLIWVYLSWIVALIGAEITHFLFILRTSPDKLLAKGNNHDFLCAYHILGHLWKAQGEGQPVELEHLVSTFPAYGAQGIENALIQLQNNKVAMRNEHGDWFLARDLSRYTLLDLYRSRQYPLPKHLTIDSMGEGLRPVLDQIEGTIDTVMDLPMSDLFKTDTRSLSENRNRSEGNPF